ncbi:MAG: tetratricopeptide repeat protein [Candidatus Kariarchaeaceae archaeon]|jgi:tetratricopeptide (TPR) repeat protein
MSAEDLLIHCEISQLEKVFAEKLRDPFSVIVEAEYLHHKGQYEQSINLVKENLKIGSPYRAEALVITGYDLLYLSREDEVASILDQIRSIEAFLTPRYQIEFKILEVTHAMFTGEFDRSGGILIGMIDNLPESSYSQGRILHTYGLNLHFQGKYMDALKYYHDALLKFETIGNHIYAARSIHNIASIYAHQGKIEDALLLYEDEISRLETLGMDYIIGLALTDVGNAHFIQGRYQQAKEVCIRSNELLRHPGGSLVDLIENSVILIQAMIELGEIDETKVILEEMEEIFKDHQSKKWYPYYKLAKALVLHSTGRTREKADAITLAEEILSAPMIDIDNYTLTLRYMIRFLLEEYRSYQHPQSLIDIDAFIDIFLDTAEQGEASSYIPEFHLYKGVTSIIDGHYEKAEILLMQALLSARDQKLDHLSRLISVELDKLPSGEDGENTEPPSIEEWQSTLERVSTYNRDQDIPKEVPVTFFMVNKNGNLLYSQEFTGKTTVEMNLMANFISAVHSFAHQTFSESGTLERIKHGSYTILLNEINQLIIGYVFEGPMYHAIRKLGDFVKRLNEKSEFWDELDPYEITPTSISILNQLVEQAFPN